MRFLSDADVVSLVSVSEASSAIEAGFRALAGGRVAVQRRTRTPSRIGKLSILGAVLEDEMVAGAKLYTTAPDGSFRFVVVLFDPERAGWLATIEAGELTRIRTTATSLMAARALARPDSSTLTVFGAGVQARSHAVAFAESFPLGEIRLVNRRSVPDLMDELASGTGVEVVQLDDPDAAVAGADLVVTATRAEKPLFAGEALSEGVHVTSVGATLPSAQELDETVVRRASRVAVEDKQQAREEAGNLIGAQIDWGRVDELAEIASGRAAGRTTRDEITMFDSLGTGLADVAVAALCFRRAVETGRGTSLNTIGKPV
jgi:ornithine cyclodeaminase